MDRRVPGEGVKGPLEGKSSPAGAGQPPRLGSPIPPAGVGRAGPLARAEWPAIVVAESPRGAAESKGGSVEPVAGEAELGQQPDDNPAHLPWDDKGGAETPRTSEACREPRSGKTEGSEHSAKPGL